MLLADQSVIHQEPPAIATHPRAPDCGPPVESARKRRCVPCEGIGQGEPLQPMRPLPVRGCAACGPSGCFSWLFYRVVANVQCSKAVCLFYNPKRGVHRASACSQAGHWSKNAQHPVGMFSAPSGARQGPRRPTDLTQHRKVTVFAPKDTGTRKICGGCTQPPCWHRLRWKGLFLPTGCVGRCTV